MERFHFDLGHVGDATYETLVAKTRGTKFALETHTNDTLFESAEYNPAVAALVRKTPDALTHFVHLPNEHFHENSLTRVQVVSDIDESDSDNYLSPLHHVVMMPTFEDYVKHFESHVAKNGIVLPHLFNSFGFESIDQLEEDPWEVLVATYHLQGPLDVAKYLVGHHPQSMSNKPQVHLAMQTDHVYPKAKSDPASVNQCNAVESLKNSIQQQGQPGGSSGFSRVTQSTDAAGKPMTFGFDVGGRKKGDKVLAYELTEETGQWLASAAAGPLRSARNDP